MDDALVRAVRGGAEQIVVLGAGYDMRAYRSARRSAAVRSSKSIIPPLAGARRASWRSMPPSSHRSMWRRVEVDFETQSFRAELRQTGFRERGKTFFVWEGVSMYLTRAAVKDTLETMRAMSAAGSQVVLDLWYLQDDHDLRGAARRFSSNLLALLGEPVTFALHPEDAGAFFSASASTARDRRRRRPASALPRRRRIST